MTEDAFTIEADVILPSLHLGDLPFSAWEIYTNQAILAANSFENSTDSWRQATQHVSSLVRIAAYYLLTHPSSSQDTALFHQALLDADESVRALAAYGLVQLGDVSALDIIIQVAALDVEAYLGAIRAAGILAELGDGRAFTVILRAMASPIGAIRVWGMKQVRPFVALQGQPIHADETVDVWPVYERALQDDDANMRYVARQQLKELGSPEAATLLEKYT